VVLALPCDALVVLCGPAACGKSTFARRHFLGTEIVSSDRCRAMLADDEDCQWVSGRAFEVFYTLIGHRLELGRMTVADSTALERSSRARLLSLARRSGRPAHLLVFDVSVETCLARDAMRRRRVGRAVIARHRAALSAQLPRLGEEGFDAVHLLSEEQMDDLVIRRAPHRTASEEP